MAGSEKLRKILEAAQERVKDREKEEGGGEVNGGKSMGEGARGGEREERYWSDGSVPSGKRENGRSVVSPPIR